MRQEFILDLQCTAMALTRTRRNASLLGLILGHRVDSAERNANAVQLIGCSSHVRSGQSVDLLQWSEAFNAPASHRLDLKVGTDLLRGLREVYAGGHSQCQICCHITIAS